MYDASSSDEASYIVAEDGEAGGEAVGCEVEDRGAGVAGESSLRRRLVVIAVCRRIQLRDYSKLLTPHKCMRGVTMRR
jgi:hypothetical protein